MQSFWLKTSWIQYVLSVVPPGIIRFKLCVVACETSKGCAKKAKKGVPGTPWVWMQFD